MQHFYIEGQKIVSLPAETLVKAGKLGDMGENQELLNPKDTTRAGNNGNHPIDWDNKKEHLKDFLLDNFEELGLTGAVFTAGKSGKIPYGQIKKYYRNSNGIIDGYGSDSINARNYDGNKAELSQFYYHPDHLGSSNYITNVSGEVYQHMEYFPFGETFIEERNGTDYTNYLYNGKEFDEEIGLYYYGARYYDPRISMFYGIDPLADKYPGISSYAYVMNNPINAIDTDGRLVIFVNGYHQGTAGVIGINNIKYGGNMSRAKSYWNGLDNKIVSRLRDDNVRYFDGGTRAFSGAKERYSNGMNDGLELIKSINSGDVTLGDGETIKIFAHSQGSAHAAGMSKALIDAGYEIEVIYNIAPRDPEDISTPDEVGRAVQYGSKKDMIAPQSSMSGNVEDGGGPSKDGRINGHLLENYHNILDIKKGENGYVAPRKDNKK